MTTTTDDKSGRQFYAEAIAEGRAAARRWRESADGLDAELDVIEAGVAGLDRG